MSVRAWRCLRGTRDGALILAVDFRAGRSEAGFDRLAEHLDVPAALVQPPVPSVQGGAALAAAWLADVAGAEHRVRAVLGYCAGASLACALADGVVATGAPPPELVLFDPAEVSREIMAMQFAIAARSVAHSAMTPAPDEKIAELRTSIDSAESIDGNLLGQLAAAYRDVAKEAFAALDISEFLLDEMHHRFVAYLGYLRSAHELPVRSSSCDPVVILSRDHHTAHPGRRAYRFDTARADLLADEAVGTTVASLILSRTREPPVETDAAAPGVG